MLGGSSLNSSSSHDQEEEEPSDLDQYQHQRCRQQHNPLDHHQALVAAVPVVLPPTTSETARRGALQMMTTAPASASIHIRQLLISCAELISQSDFFAALRLVSILSENSSPHGDSMERLVHQFVRALSLRLSRHVPNIDHSHHHINIIPSPSSANFPHHHHPYHHPRQQRAAAAGASYYMTMSHDTTSNISNCDALLMSSDGGYCDHHQHQLALESCYLTLNQVTPFIRFSHLTANQAILEAIQTGQQSIHIIDFDIMHGVQWPPLMQALADRSNSSSISTTTTTSSSSTTTAIHNFHPPPMLRITGTGTDLNILHRTGDRLLKFAQSLGLRFQFHPILLLNNDPTYLPSTITLLPDEALAVNCVLYLHRLLKDDSRDLRLFLHRIKALNPKVVTVAEREASHNHPMFMQRFVEALDHYAALFGSLEATLPPNSSERLAVEQIWFGKEIMDIVAAEGDSRRERHERFESWQSMLRSAGFSSVPLSPFALSQAKLLLRLHYPSEGYHLQILDNACFLGWQNRPLFSVSSWH